MEARRRKYLLLGATALVVIGAIYRAWQAGPSVTPFAASSERDRAAAGGQAAPAGAAAPDVHLNALEAERPKPGSGERNLFRFKPKAAPPPPAPGGATGGTRPPVVAPVPSGPPPPPPLAPISYKFIGIVEATERSAKIAVLSDGRNVFQGREGDIIEGRYRILRIGEESIDIAYLDGRGRQTIRLTGS